MDITITTGILYRPVSRLYMAEYLNSGSLFLALNKCPYMVLKHEREIGDELSRNGVVTTKIYKVLAPVFLKISYIETSSGESDVIYIQVDKDAPKIQLIGPEPLIGRFEGRGTIDFEKSNLSEKELIKKYDYKLLEIDKSMPNSKEIKLRKIILE